MDTPRYIFNRLKYKNEAQDTFLVNKSKLFRHNYSFAHFPEMGFLRVAQYL